ncbi:hypothetical protein BGX34_004920 [Mortierella sp. NVP85]|nr:hypothetical protein BGX34_004920 [Mortierella sp. NVP85]
MTSLSQSLTLSPMQPQDQQSPSSAGVRPKAILSRYLVQRLHFGYYGNKSVLSELAVRYLTARARLEFGYFVIRGRAFWNVLAEDLVEERQDMNLTVPTNREREGRDTKSGERNDSQRRQWQLLHLQQQARQGQNQGQGDDNDPSVYKDDDPDSVEQRQKIMRGHQRCEEREEELLMLEAVKYLNRKCPELLGTLMADIATSLSSSAASAASTMTMSERQAAASHWRCVALSQLVESQADLGDETLAHIPPTPFLTRRKDRRWMESLQQPPAHLLKLQDSNGQARFCGNMRMIQDDARLFQTASGLFEGLPTYPRKWRGPVNNIIDGPLSYSPEILKCLIFDYGYMPLPDDDADRKMHFKGGDRAATGDTDGFPSDGSHVVNKRNMKGAGTSIWYFYELQPAELVVSFLMHRAPEALDWLFERGFELMIQTDPNGPGISRTLLLQCCLPNCHAMVRHVFQAPTGSPCMQPSLIAITAKTELLGRVGKPARIQFQQEDFAQVIKGVASTHLEKTLKLMMEFGMEVSIVQDRLFELLQVPGGLSPTDVEEATLHILFVHCTEHAKPLVSAAASEPSLGTIELVNRAIQQSFEVQMGPVEEMDQEWKFMFEETIMNFRQAQLIVHPHVSNWILASLEPEHIAFQICFDHALLEALSKIAEWNTVQLKRLRKWVKNQENEASMKSIVDGRQWEEMKKRLVVDRDMDTDVSVQRETLHGRIGLDIEWTTNRRIARDNPEIVANVPKGDVMISVSDDNRLQLDNGITQEFSICRQRISEDDEPDANMVVEAFLRKEAIVQEKHFIWLAMGLVTASLQGERVIDIPNSKTTGGQSQSIPVRMACSTEAYRLVCLLAFAYVRQSMLDEDDSMMSDLSSAERPYGVFDRSTVYQASIPGPVPVQVSSSSSTSSTSSSSGWVTLLPASVSKIRELEAYLNDQLGADAKLLVEILSEIECLIEKQVGEEVQSTTSDDWVNVG